MAFNEIILSNILVIRWVNLSSCCFRVPVYWWLFNYKKSANSVTREYVAFSGSDSSSLLPSCHPIAETRCSNVFLIVASKRKYVSFHRAISFASLFHRSCPLCDGHYVARVEKPLAKYTNAVCDQSKSKRFFTNSCVPVIILMRKVGITTFAANRYFEFQWII